MNKREELKTFDIKVVGFITIRARNADDALDVFDEMMRNGFTVAELRWKSLDATDLEDEA